MEIVLPFNEMVTANLKAYVYALLDPRTRGAWKDRVFYIGKGNGNRCFNHAKDEHAKGEEPLHEDAHKLRRIREIRSTNQEVEIRIIAHNLTDEAAHHLEAVLIPLLGETNQMAGNGDSKLWLTESQILEAYDKPIQRENIELFRGNVLCVSLNRQDLATLLQPGNEELLAARTLGDWVLNSQRSEQVDCIIGVRRGLIVSIFETNKSNDEKTQFERIKGETPGVRERSRFFGKRRLDLEAELRDRSVSHRGRPMSNIWPLRHGCQFHPAPLWDDPAETKAAI